MISNSGTLRRRFSRIAKLMVEAANGAGGRDNISVYSCPGPSSSVLSRLALSEGRSQACHGNAHALREKMGSRSFSAICWLLLVGMLLGLGGLAFLYGRDNDPDTGPVAVTIAPHIRRRLVDATDSLRALRKPWSDALPGDTIVVPAGNYLRAAGIERPGEYSGAVGASHVIHSDPAVGNDSGLDVVARGVKEGARQGFAY